MLDRQIMFNQLQELQRQKKLQEFKNAHLSLMPNKQSSVTTQYGLLNYGVPVRDASQMFMFGDTNSVPALPNRSIFSQAQNQHLSQGLQFGGQTIKVKQVNNHNRGLNQDSTTLDPIEQKISFNTENNIRGTSIVKSENLFENKDKSSDSGFIDRSIVTVNKEEGGKWLNFEVNPGIGQQVSSSRGQSNIWVQQNPPSTPYAEIRKMEIGFGQGSSKTHPRGNRGHAVVRTKKQAPVVKKERLDNYDNTVPQITSISQLSSPFGYYKSPPILSSASLVKPSVDQCTGTHKFSLTVTSSSSDYLQHLNVAKENMVELNSKKRKHSTSKQLSSLHDTSNAELEWAHSANRMPEKVPDSISNVDRKRRRLILTTQLMQQLFQPAPKNILSEDATKHCDMITYYITKFGVDDARKSSKINGDKDLSKVLEGFIDRSKKVEDFLSRLDEGESTILDIKVEFQDLDKFAIISRFATFHSREPLVTSGTSASNGPQLYVTASPMPSIVPEGRYCLSL